MHPIRIVFQGAISVRNSYGRNGIGKIAAAIIVILVVIVAGLAYSLGATSGGNQVTTQSSTTRSSISTTSNAESTAIVDYTQYLFLANPNATVTNGQASTCDTTYFFCTITVNPGSQVTFNFLIDSNLSYAVTINMVLNASITTYSGSTTSESTQELKSGTISVNPGQNSESVLFSIPSNGVSDVITNVGAKLEFCGGVVSYCGFTNTTLLYLNTGYDVNS